MERKIWTTPFGLALAGGSALALIAGYAYGTNAIAVEQSGYNQVIGLDNMSQTLDENLLIEANREPVTEVPVRESGTRDSAPPAEPRESEAEPPDVAPPEPAEPDEPPVVTVNESEDE